ncbi:MAG: metallophosphoesterase [Clostridia bacterium]|nr:metallophosphoesterase [Clostridia bacterium]
MLRFGVISDTHGVSPAIDAALRAIGEVDGYLHLGDVVSDAERIAKETGKPVHAVRGNCDTLSFSEKDQPVERVLEIEGARLLLVHGHRHEIDMYTTYAARQRAIELGCGALIYGHTHIPQLVQRDGIIVLNPGSPARPRAGAKPACAVLEIDGGKLRAKIITL